MALYFSTFKPFISLINSKIILSHQITDFILLYFKSLYFSYKLKNNIESLTNKQKQKITKMKKFTHSNKVVCIPPNSLKMKNNTMKNRCLRGRTKNIL